MVRFAIDGMLSFSQMPLRLASAFGVVCSIVAFIFMIYGFVIKYFYPEFAIQGWASIFVASLFIGGVQLMSIGILGEYIGRMYDEIKGRPLYIVDEETRSGAEEIKPEFQDAAYSPRAADADYRETPRSQGPAAEAVGPAAVLLQPLRR